MSTSLKAMASGFHYVKGVSYEGAPHALVAAKGDVVPQRSPKGNLYVLVEVINHPHGSDAIANQLANLIQKTYFGSRGTITAGLRGAISAANQHLLDHNLKLPYEEQKDGSVCCAVLRGTDAFIARAGPCSVFHIRGTRWQRFPQSETDDPAGSAPVPIGLRKETEVAYHHVDLAPGDQLILIESRGAQALRQASGIIPAEVAATTALRDAGKKADFSFLMIDLDSTTPASAPTLSPSGVPRQVEPGAPVSGATLGQKASQPLPPRLEHVHPEPRREVRDEDATLDALIETALSAEMEDATLAEQRSPFPAISLDAEQPDLSAPLSRQARDSTGSASACPVAEDLPVVDRVPQKPQRGKGTLRRYSRLAAILALLAPFLVIGAVLGYNWFQQREEERTFRQQLITAQEFYNTARTTTDRAVARSALDAAQLQLRQALELRPDDQTALRLGQDMTTLDHQIRMITPLYYVAELYRFPDPASVPQRMAVSGRDIYVLDRQNSVVTLHVMNEVGDGLQRGQEAIEIVRKGQQVGNTVVGNLIDLTWMPAGGDWQQDSLIILDASGHLIVYNQMGLSSHPLAGAGNIQAPLVIASFTGARLYLLDTIANQILRFTPTASGYTVAPESYLAADVQVDLRNTRDLAIDGDIWILFADGIGRFQAGRPIAFDLRGLEEPFSSPTSLYTSLSTGAQATRHVYVADPGNKRVVKISKEGLFIRQFRPVEEHHFDRLTDIYVSETDSRLYFLADDSIFLSILPQGEP